RAVEHAGEEGHAARIGLIHGQRAVIELERGALPDAQIEAETGLLLIEESHFATVQLISVAMVVHIERGDLASADELRQRGDRVGVFEDRAFIGDYLTARGRLRIAQGQVREGVEDLLVCRPRLRASGLLGPSDWRVFGVPALVSLGEREQAAELAQEQVTAARHIGVPGGIGRALRAAAVTVDGAERLKLLEAAVSVLETSSARLELA